jgi:hypothetical protein
MFFLPAILSAQKEKPSEINDSRGFVVAGVVLLSLRLRECHFGVALLMKALFALLTTFFFIAALMKASFQCAPIKKPGSSIQAFSSRLYV